MSKKNDGSAAQYAFIERVMAQPGAWVERFRDSKDLRGINGGRHVGDFPKPSDYLVTIDGAHHYAEVKSSHAKNRFPFGQIEKYQHATAIRMASLGAPYKFYIFSYENSRWYIMDCQQYAEAINRNESSIKFEDLPEWK